MSEVAIKVSNLKKIYQRGSEAVAAVNDVSFEINSGEFVSIVGPSGSGKTTLLNLAGCLDNPDQGQVMVNGKQVFSVGNVLPETELTKIRRENYGYIFQNFYLIPTLTVLENVLLPLTFYSKTEPSDVRGKELLDELGMSARLTHLPTELSGGEMQRVAIARALINNPSILLADEPTGNLDTKRSEEIGKTLQLLNSRDKITIVMVTHNV